MKSHKITFNRAKQARDFLAENRQNVISVNGVECNPRHPIFEASKNYISYWHPMTQNNIYLQPPYEIRFTTES